MSRSRRLSAPRGVVERARRVRLLLMDVDGTLTDGRMFHFVDSGGKAIELKATYSHDGIALLWAAQSGISTGVISARHSEGIEVRARMLRMSHVVQGAPEKVPAFEAVLAKAKVAPEETAYVGDDLHDIPVLKRAGLGVAVGDATPETKAAAHWVAASPGGRGAVREIVELILKAQGKWKAILDRYEAS